MTWTKEDTEALRSGGDDWYDGPIATPSFGERAAAHIEWSRDAIPRAALVGALRKRHIGPGCYCADSRECAAAHYDCRAWADEIERGEWPKEGER